MITAIEARQALADSRMAMYCASEAYLDARSQLAPGHPRIAERRDAWQRALIDFIQADVALCAVEDVDRLPSGPNVAAYMR